MMPNNAAQLTEQLAQLHDIRLPQEISGWPLAPGWWLALGLILLATIITVLVIILKRRTLKYVALRELERLRIQSGDASSMNTLATEVGVLIRRVVLSRKSFGQLASAHSDVWQSFLMTAPKGMSESIASFIVTAPYSPLMSSNDNAHSKISSNDIPTKEALINETKNWIRRHV